MIGGIQGSTFRRWQCWAALGLSVLIYAVVGLAMHQPFHEGPRALRDFDLGIYRDGAVRIAHGLSLYDAPMLHGLGFTYPPFAALCLLPLAAASQKVDELWVVALNLVLLVWLMRRTLLLADSRGAGADRGPSRRADAWALAALLAAAALWLEPISVTLGYGQIDLLVAALVVGDLSRPDGARAKGVGIGLAAALKLTPLLLIVYLLLSGRRRAAALASAVFAGSIGVAYAALGSDAARYWGGHLFLDSGRIGDVADPFNQSLRGAIARLAPHASLELLVVCVAIGGLGLAVHYSRRGDEAAGYSLAAVTTLLASPISWTHHWALAVPALVLLGRRARHRRSRRLGAATAALICLGIAYIPEWARPIVRHSGVLTLLADPYVIAAGVALTATAVGLVMPRAADAPDEPVRVPVSAGG